jgi:K+-sensing histidine kinase KdpD
MISEITDAMCVIDHEDRVLWVNSTFQVWFSHHGSALGKKLDAVMSGASGACSKGAVFSDIDTDNRKRYYKVECVPTFDEHGQKVSDLIAFRDVTIMQTLLNISDLTVSTSSARELIDRALDIIGETLGYRTIAALLYESGELELAASRGYSPMLRSLLARQRVSPKEKGLAGRSAYLNQVIVKEIKKGTVSDMLLRESTRLGITSVITVPLSERGVLVGVLAVSTAESPSADQVNLLKIVCNQLALSLRKILFEEELVSARDEMELYIDLMCHDITNANQVALGYIELARSKPEEYDQYLNYATQNIYRVDTLIDSVRKIRRAHMNVLETVNIKGAIETAIEESRCISDKLNKDITVNVDIPEDAQVKASSLLPDLFYNVLDFTIRRVRDVATIDISLSSTDNTYDIIFADTGPGLEKENKSMSFKQLLKSPRTGPAGLGLYLLLSLVHNFGGHIYVEDRIPDEPKEGSRIVLTLKKG